MTRDDVREKGLAILDRRQRLQRVREVAMAIIRNRAAVATPARSGMVLVDHMEVNPTVNLQPNVNIHPGQVVVNVPQQEPPTINLPAPLINVESPNVRI
jgi:hypothetical protein